MNLTEEQMREVEIIEARQQILKEVKDIANIIAIKKMGSTDHEVYIDAISDFVEEFKKQLEKMKK